MRILVVEDDAKMADLLSRGLREEGAAVDVATNGEDAQWMARAVDHDAIVLDVNLPGMDGFETCRRIRAGGVWSPVRMLTARDAVEDGVAGLDTGADDYLTEARDRRGTLRGVRLTRRRIPADLDRRRHRDHPVLELGQHAGTNAAVDVDLFYAVTDPDQAVYLDELRAAAARVAGLRLHLNSTWT
jgi:DNA-binding response OmpR family regulator